MNYSELLPHLFASCSLIETQIKKLEDVSSKISTPDVIEFEGVIAAHKKLSQTANFLQLSIAKNDTAEIKRYISIFYGLLYMTRPSLTRLVSQYLSLSPCAVLVKASNQSEVIMH